MPLSDALKKAYGLFVEVDPNAVETETISSVAATPSAAPTPRVTKTVEQIAREQPGPNLDEIKVPSTPAPAIERADGSVDYHGIYALAGLPEAAFPAEKALEIFGSFPAELPLEAKRATMKVTISALGATLGVTPETVVADASRKLAALNAYAGSYTDQAKTYVQKAEEEIQRLEGEIARRKESIEVAKGRQVRMVECCNKEADRLDDVLEFFSLDTGTSKLAPPTS